MRTRHRWRIYQTTPHLKGNSYIIYNEGNNGRIIFRDEEDMLRFIRKFKYYLDPFIAIEAYTLIANHFHLKFTVRKKFKRYGNKYVNLNKTIERLEKLSKRKRESIIIGEMMRRFFMSYAKYYNHKYGESGSLFRKNYKRIFLESTGDEIRAVIFIHKNPQKHKLVVDFRNYIWSSYQIYKDQAKWLITSGNLFYKLFGNVTAMELAHDNHDDNDQDIQIEY